MNKIKSFICLLSLFFCANSILNASNSAFLNPLMVKSKASSFLSKFSFDNGNKAIEDGVEEQVISVFDSLSYRLEENTSWSISNLSGNLILKSGIGSIDKFVFPEAGKYKIDIAESADHAQNECKHGLFPKRILVEVSPSKLKFDFSSIKFKNEIIGGQSQYGNELSIDVYLSSVNNQSVEFNTARFTSAGIGVSIEGKLDNGKTVLTPGVNHLVYKLSGVATSETFIMFDFLDINNQIVSYSLPSKIK